MFHSKICQWGCSGCYRCATPIERRRMKLKAYAFGAVGLGFYAFALAHSGEIFLAIAGAR